MLIRFKKTMLVVQKFNIQEIDLVNVRTSRKKFSKNINSYVKWLIEYLKKTVPSDKKYSISGIYMSEKNCKLLQKYFNQWDWLNYSPIDLQELKDDEIGIDLSKLFDVP